MHGPAAICKRYCGSIDEKSSAMEEEERKQKLSPKEVCFGQLTSLLGGDSDSAPVKGKG